jgi:DNA-binding response OmpR family regulator/signal transduction histidine kinase
MAQTILVADDDAEIARLVRAYLEQAGFRVRVAIDGEQALHALRAERPDLAILDVMMPKRDGFALIALIRADAQLSALPLLLLTARVDDLDKLRGLSLGADDYLTKPFNPHELVARAKAILRRAGGALQPAPVLRNGALALQLEQHTLLLAGGAVELTPTEFELLRAFLQYPGRVFTRGELIEVAFGDAFDGFERTIDTHIKNLRKKIEADPAEPAYVLTCGMNRLWVRLSLAMLAVTLISVLIVTLIAEAGARRQFDDFVSRQRALTESGLVEALAEHYTTRGSWEGAHPIIVSGIPELARPRRPGPGGLVRPIRAIARYALVDVSGQVILGDENRPTGVILRSSELDAALPITANQQRVGYLLPIAGQFPQTEPQQLFLTELRQTLLKSVVLAGLLAIALGVVLSWVLTAPLATLADAARQFSQRKLDVRVVPTGAQEFAAVGQAFNAMADSLQQAEINRRNLTADIAHELRTPLTVMQGNLRAMLDGVYPLEQEQVSKVYTETRLMSRLVDDLRVLSLADAGKLDLRLERVAAANLIDAAVAQFAVAAENAQVALHATPVDTALTLTCDADRTAQVLRNLIANALRHTAAGGQVTVSIARVTSTARISVADSGSGIAPEHLPHVFDRFYRADASRARHSGGSGLGLAIAKSLVEAMGGSVGASSTVGQGSVFWLEVPLVPGVLR